MAVSLSRLLFSPGRDTIFRKINEKELVTMPSPKTTSTGRNQTMECFKLIASILVVFLHCPFPGQLGKAVSILGSVAVPMFFTITGYFNYGSERTAVVRRLKHLLRLYLIVAVASVVSRVISTELQGGSTIAFLRTYCPDLNEVMRLLILHQDPRNAQLWYLISVCFCYLVLLLYLDFRGGETTDYRPLYILGACQFSVFLSLGCLATLVGMQIPYLLWFNGYYYGICFFSLGIFLHEYQQRILENFHLTPKKLCLLLAAGVILSFLQSLTIGSGQIPLGGMAEVVALLLLAVSCPAVTRRPGFLSGCVAKFGPWSTYIYLLHVIIIGLYEKHLQPSVLALTGNPQLEAYLSPLIVAALSLLAAMVYTWADQVVGKRRRK